MFAGRLFLSAVVALAVPLAILATPSAGQAATFGHAGRFGGTADEDAPGFAVDAAGNAYLTGTFLGSADFDPGPGTDNEFSAGSTDVYVVKVDAAGNRVWAESFGGLFAEQSNDVAVDGSGNVYVVGSFVGTADFDPSGTHNLSSAGSADAFVVKLHADGDLVWARNLGGTSFDEARAVAVDGAGNVYVSGTFQGMGDFDPGAGTVNLTSAGADDVFLVKVDEDGDLVWARAFGGTGNDLPNALVVNAAGTASLTGAFVGTSDFDPGVGTANLTAVGSFDVFVVKVNANGGLVWARAFGGPRSDIGLDITVDATGRVFVTGEFETTVDFDPGSGVVNLSSVGSDDAFAVKLDANGGLIWARSLGGTASDFGYGIAVDPDGNVYLSGFFRGSADFDPGPGTVSLTSAGEEDAFALKLDANGGLVWARALGGTTHDRATRVGVDGTGSVHVAGTFDGTADFDPGPGTANLVAVGEFDAFAVKLVQAAPPVHTVPGLQHTIVNRPVLFSTATGNRIAVADADAGSSPARVTLEMGNGHATLSTTAGLTFIVGDGAADVAMTFDGTLTAINAALEGLVFTPNPGFRGEAALQIMTLDRVGPTGGQTDVDKVTIAVAEPNSGPTAVDDVYNVQAGRPLTVPVQAGVLANDSDLEGTPLTAILATGATQGALTLNPDGSFVYTPQPSFAGTDSFTYRASDGEATSNPATVRITVTATDCTPRPRVIATPIANGGRLDVRVEATPLGTQTSNAIQRVTFDRLDNVRVALNGQVMASGQTYIPTSNTSATAFTVERLTPGQPTTVHFRVQDACGEWRTFVGGGTNAGF